MYKRFVNSLYLLNIIFQSFLNLLTPIGIGLLISYLLTSYAGAPSWIWALFTVLGVFAGLISMVKFILSATAALDRLEKEQNERQKNSNRNIRHTASREKPDLLNEEGASKNEE